VPNWKIGAKNLLFMRLFLLDFLGTAPQALLSPSITPRSDLGEIKNQGPKTRLYGGLPHRRSLVLNFFMLELTMSFSLKKEVKEILKKYKIFPQKRFGQNFLINKNIIYKILESAEIKNDDIVLEIGPGLGFLTKELAKKAKKIIAIEKDINMVEILKKELSDFKNIKIINQDILKIKNLKIKNYKIVANIPYYITGPIIKKFLLTKEKPSLMVLMVQKEVAQRIVAKSPKANFLSIFVQFLADCKIISFVKKENFFPKPKVDSAIIKLIPKENLDFIFLKNFFIILKAGFLHPRKTILNNFSEYFKKNKEEIKKLILENNISDKKRPGELTIEEWLTLNKVFKNYL
jgi:16S rRNA (adenine1518-N6/adenine1519-N6)-dimethyltransferase